MGIPNPYEGIPNPYEGRTHDEWVHIFHNEIERRRN
jgi:hypothetical protein